MAVTPMMKQYFEIKEQYKDFILFYRLGDFYEMFYEDAVIASRELELTLTGKDCGEEERAPMCGVPFHSCDGYIGKLIERGYKVAICEQTEDPSQAKGLVKREVVRVITPGTVIESELLTETKNNYLCAICAELAVNDDNGKIGICFADISTGQLSATMLEGGETSLINELGTYSPSEIIIDVDLKLLPKASEFIKERLHSLTEDGQPQRFLIDDNNYSEVQTQFSELGKSEPTVVRAVLAILGYIRETQMKDTSNFKNLNFYTRGQYLEMDINTRRNLELTENMRQKEKRGSLFWVLDNTVTSMGARMLRSWVERPLIDVRNIVRRQGAVRDFVENMMMREEVRTLLEHVLDLERLMTKVIYGTANAKDLRAICSTIEIIPELKSILSQSRDEEISSICNQIDTLEDVWELIDKSINPEPPFSVREGNLIADGFNNEVDNLRNVMHNGKGMIEEFEERERQSTGIKNLKIGYNRVFGYYIELSKSFTEQAPAHYVRKQTLSNCERYITDELKNMESTILGASDKLSALDFDLFSEIRNTVASHSERIQKTAVLLAKLDVYRSLAETADQNNYVCPEVDYSDVIEIKEGRHPVVEKFVKDSYFVPNDTYLDTSNNRLMLITGPNMAGKSTYMRQTALIVVMAQIGSFVPAKDARIGVADRLFTRVGASDDLASGQSTFMLEMTEVSYILANATRRSFIIYDEIGRGTSTYDGMSIARAVAEYTCSKKIGAKTMFATHYHELTVLEDEFKGVVNYNIAAKKRGDGITFLRKIVRGATDDSYGIEVAKLAGLPNSVIKRAREILKSIENGEYDKSVSEKSGNAEPSMIEMPMISMEDIAMHEAADRIKNTDLNTLTPIEALQMLFDLKKLF